MNEILISVNLPGVLEGSVAHTTTQNHTVDVSALGERPKFVTNKILHTDRKPLPCTKEIHISEEVMRIWMKENPFWIKPYQWKKFSIPQKIQTYVDSFDEGFGVSYQ